MTNLTDNLLVPVKIEGLAPERALARLAKAGVEVVSAKKAEKTALCCCVRQKDLKKVFAIYPKMCYNGEKSGVFGGYVVKKQKKRGTLAFLARLKNRVGVFLGLALFFAGTSFFQNFVLKIRLVGDQSYREEALETLSKCGIEKGKPYAKTRGKKAVSALFSLDGVEFASVKKDGSVLTVEIRSIAENKRDLAVGALCAPRDGILFGASVLRGTLERKIGEKIARGDRLVGDYILIEDRRKNLPVIARVILLCEEQKLFHVKTISEAVGQILLETGGETKEISCEEREDGIFVKRTYFLTVSMNMGQ